MESTYFVKVPSSRQWKSWSRSLCYHCPPPFGLSLHPASISSTSSSSSSSSFYHHHHHRRHPHHHHHHHHRRHRHHHPLLVISLSFSLIVCFILVATVRFEETLSTCKTSIFNTSTEHFIFLTMSTGCDSTKWLIHLIWRYNKWIRCIQGKIYELLSYW